MLGRLVPSARMGMMLHPAADQVFAASKIPTFAIGYLSDVAWTRNAQVADARRSIGHPPLTGQGSSLNPPPKSKTAQIQLILIPLPAETGGEVDR